MVLLMTFSRRVANEMIRRVERIIRATGSDAEIGEERRLLYVAMTRARDALHLIVLQRFFSHGQSAYGDRHVYAARTRFIPDNLLGLFDCTVWPAVVADPAAARQLNQGVRLDVGARGRR